MNFLVGLFPTKDMQTPFPSPLRNGPILIEDAQSAESDEKTIFWFLFFAKWSILCWKFLENRPQ